MTPLLLNKIVLLVILQISIASAFDFRPYFPPRQPVCDNEECDEYKSEMLQLPKGGFPKATGSVWPQPQVLKSLPTFMLVDQGRFAFKAVSQSCDIIENAFSRYYKWIFTPPRMTKRKVNKNATLQWKRNPNYFGNYPLTQLDVKLSSPCATWPTQDMDEQYILNVNTAGAEGSAYLFSQSVWGILRGLETFSQLIYRTEDGLYLINSTFIRDFPRFPFRGVMLDTSRHFVHKSIIKETLEAMAQNKLNVFHWHIVDDPSFPYESRTFPSLSEKGAFNPYTHTYSLIDITEIIEFARVRGIRVVSEFDTPGHTQSWGFGLSNLLTQCYKNESGELIPNGFGPINPSLESTYDFLTKFFSEVSRVFPEKFLHLGGDEVSFDCWQSNPDIIAFMEKQGYGTNYSKLEEYYMQRLLNIVKSFPTNNSYIIWQEVIDNGVEVKPDTIVEVWKSPFQEEMSAVTSKGYRVLLSACWYLNYISYGADWPNFYSCEPHDFNGTNEQKNLVMGGEACMWGEYVDGTNLTPRLWVRASAVAERLWSDQSVNDTVLAASRLEEQRCRMLARGINAEPPNGPSYCDVDHFIHVSELFL